MKETIYHAYTELDHDIAQGKITAPNAEAVQQIHHKAKQFAELILAYVKEHGLHANARKFYDDILQQLQQILETKNSKGIEHIWEKILSIYANINYYGATYVIGVHEDLKQQHQPLTEQGKIQAKEFSAYLAKEILASPKPVKVFLYYSPYSTTASFAEILEHNLEAVQQHFNKKIEVHKQEEPRLHGDLIDRTQMHDLDTWFDSENGTEATNYIFNFFTNTQYNDEAFFRINIGITHLPLLALFLANHFHIATEKAIQNDHFVKYQFGDFFFEEWR